MINNEVAKVIKNFLNYSKQNIVSWKNQRRVVSLSSLLFFDYIMSQNKSELGWMIDRFSWLDKKCKHDL